MRGVRLVLFGMTWLVAAATGVYLVLAATAAPSRGGLDDWIARRPESAAPLGILLAGLALLAAMSLHTRSAGADELRYPTEGGEVRIRMSALRDYVVRLMDGVRGVDTVRCCATRERERVRIELHCRVPTGQSAVEFARQLQTLIRNRLSDDIGMVEIGEICVRVTGFIASNGRAASAGGVEAVGPSPEVG